MGELQPRRDRRFRWRSSFGLFFSQFERDTVASPVFIFDLLKPGKRFGIAEKEVDEEANNVYDASNEHLPAGPAVGNL